MNANHVPYFTFLLAKIGNMRSHIHLLVGEMCSHMHLFVRCVTTHICL